MSDAAARERALDPAQSFILQAPAGSGKTGLLTQRYLRLLALVDAPEQIVAITFTLKAAAEMRRRILSALRGADSEPRIEHDARTRQLAEAARQHAKERGWQLESHPARLRIQSIDAFCLGLASQSPLLSRAGAELKIVPDARPLYALAARHTLASVGDREGPQEALAILLQHRDNEVEPAQQLVAEMLERRDQWLPLVLSLQGAELRSRLENDLAREAVGHFHRLVRRWPAENLGAVTGIARRSGTVAPFGTPAGTAWRDSKAPPAARSEDFDRWQSLARLLLTKEGDWRKRIDNNADFVVSKPDKDLLGNLLTELGREEALDKELRSAGELPEPNVTDEQWRVLEALIAVLKHAAQELELTFRVQGKVDFTAVAAAALQALGAADQPSDLALALDYRIRHLLVDEYQDTSVSQYRLLEKLTAGWTPGDGRTFFCVGDPMQSIYRFRQAEVGLFLRTRDQGLGALQPEFLRLERNFRSRKTLVDWFNGAFAQVLPREDDMARGAVRHAPSEATRSAERSAVSVHPLFESDLQLEASQVVATVRDILSRRPDARIAVLGRQRTHLSRIAASLVREGLRFQAVELEKLASQSSVRDLTALSRALLHLGDRTAWMAVLRSPLCGLLLEDLTTLSAAAPGLTAWEAIESEDRVARLSADGRARLRRLHVVMARALAAEGRYSLRRRVESAWLELGGPSAVRDARALEDSQAFLDKLDAIENEQSLPAGNAFDALFVDLFAGPDPHASAQLQVMTVHRAKGLEFDAVILVGLGRSRLDRDPALLHWMEVAQPQDPPGLLIAPIKRTGSEPDALSTYVAARLKESESFERARLLYVAATRAREELHLFGHVTFRLDKKDGELKLNSPERGSALSLLWPKLKPVFTEAFAARDPQSPRPAPPSPIDVPLRRIALKWTAPQPDVAVAMQAAPRMDDVPVRPEFDWATETTRHVGTVVHLELERWSELPQLPTPADMEKSRDRLARLLRANGVPRAMVADALERVVGALQSTLGDPRGRWIFDVSHREARSELALSAQAQGEFVSVRIDRTFLDQAGVRWVVDFKTSTHLGAGLEEFLDSEVNRYRPQLERYAQFVRTAGPQPVRQGLYFPLLKSWREW